MITEERVDIWDPRFDIGWWRCITTNGTIKQNGLAVLGRGVALQAATKYPEFAAAVGKHLREKGNVVGLFPQWHLISFPVKHEWMLKATLPLIQQSCQQLTEYLPVLREHRIILPRPGCGNGQLDWQDVKPIVYKELAKVRVEVVICWL